MEYADGGSLKQYLKENFKNLGKININLGSSWLVPHDKEIVHHDLVIYLNYSF